MDLKIQTAGISTTEAERRLQTEFERIDSTALVRVCPEGDLSPELLPVFRAQRLRDLAPPAMIVSLRRRKLTGERSHKKSAS